MFRGISEHFSHSRANHRAVKKSSTRNLDCHTVKRRIDLNADKYIYHVSREIQRLIEASYNRGEAGAG